MKEQKTEEKIEEVKEKEAYELTSIPTGTAPAVVDVKKSEVISSEEALVLLLNKVDRIEKAIVGK